MKIINKTKKTILSADAVEVKSFIDRSVGLIDPNKPRTLLFNTRFGIHTFGLSEAIDVLVLDKENKVVSIKESLYPNRIFLWHPSFSTVIELPKRVINETKTETGDLISFG